MNTETLITLQQLKGVGNKTILELAHSQDIGNFDDLLASWPSLKGKRFANISADALEAANHRAHQIKEASERDGIGIISYFEKDFPERLRHCLAEDGKKDPPVVLYYRGNLNALKVPSVAIIGTRTPTPAGIAAGRYVASAMAKEGFNIVSGLALGCDTSGHEGALDAGGLTTAFLAGSLAWKDIYPQENLELARRIVSGGGILLSEYPLGAKSGRYAFVARDRLQAGLSFATVVVQTGVRGGTMHAVNATLAAHKPLFAIQYKRKEDLDHPNVQGNNKLLGDGAAMPLGSDNIAAAIEEIKRHLSHAQENHNTLFKDEEYDF